MKGILTMSLISADLSWKPETRKNWDIHVNGSYKVYGPRSTSTLHINFLVGKDRYDLKASPEKVIVALRKGDKGGWETVKTVTNGTSEISGVCKITKK
jgi:hypothetical protein